ncbi:hypothetical protein NIES4071_20590 [Calothrix sp. NIES-4071]|nr:hypothetical protein NIES4071_20590 [Calothrix sp. NIES-4071]BAZ56391.1 hypothetical protein NIES4105_20540 [Calothrix sp. NIES-4105]
MARGPRNNFTNIPDNNPFIRNPSAFGDDAGIKAEAFAGVVGIFLVVFAGACFGVKRVRQKARERDTKNYPSNKALHHPPTFDPDRDTAWDPNVQGRYQENQLTVTWSGDEDLRVFNNQIVIKMKGGTVFLRDAIFGYSKRTQLGKRSYQVKMYRIPVPRQSDLMDSDVKYLLENEPYYRD